MIRYLIFLTCILSTACVGIAGAVSPQSSSSNVADGSQTKPPVADEQQQPENGPNYQAYLNMLKKGRELNKEIDRLYGSIPAGFPDLQKNYYNQIESLKKQQLELVAQLGDAAIAAFKEGAVTNREVVNSVMQSMVGCVQPKQVNQKFAPERGLELADMLTDSGFKQPSVYFMAFKAAYAIQDFERAEMMLKKIEELGTKLPQQSWTRLEQSRERWNREMEIRRSEAATNDLPRARFETSFGNFEVELFENHAPNAVANFVNLVEKGFYNGRDFHLVRPGILAQTGCPNGDGTGGPGYRIPCESYQKEIRHHFVGTLSFANKGKDTAGSQIYFTFQPNPVLDGKYTVFGRILENPNLLRQVNTVDKTRAQPLNSVQIPPSKISKVTILRKREHDYNPYTLPVQSANPAPGDGGSTDGSSPKAPPAGAAAPGSTTTPGSIGSGSK